MNLSIPSFYSYPTNLFANLGVRSKARVTQQEAGSSPTMSDIGEARDDRHDEHAYPDEVGNQGDTSENNNFNSYDNYDNNDHYDNSNLNVTDQLQQQINLLFEGLEIQKFEIKQLKEDKSQLLKELDEVKERDKNKLLNNNFNFVPHPDFTIPPSRKMDDFNNVRFVEFIYPKTRFSGDCKVDCFDFIHGLVKAYNTCPLSPEDFERVLTSRLNSPALTMVSGWIKRKFPMKTILNQLYSTFNKTISPPKALDVLRVYRFPRKFTTAMILGELDNLGNIALRGGTESIDSDIMICLTIIEGLRYSMPEPAYLRIRENINELRVTLGRQPYLVELFSSLKRIEDLIDYELTRHPNFQFAEDRELLEITTIEYHSKRSSKPRMDKSRFRYLNKHRLNMITNDSDGFQVNSLSTNKSKANTITSDRKPYTAQNSYKPSTGNYYNKSNAKNKVFPNKDNRNMQPLCSFCGEYTHSAHQGCYSCLDDSLKQYRGPPASENCKICLEKIKRELRHPEKYCPLRPFMLKMYSQKKATPRGIFKKYVEGQGRPQANNNNNRPMRRFNRFNQRSKA